MPSDTFICGTCHASFNDIVMFMEHKKEPCEAPQEEANIHIIQESGGAVHIVSEGIASPPDTVEIKQETDVIEGDSSVQHVQLIQVPMTDGVKLTKEQAEAVVKAANQSTSLLDNPGPTFVRLTSPLILHDESGEAITAHPVQVTPSKPPGTGRKRGRPRKGEEKKKPLSVEKKEEDNAKPSVTIGKDGRLHCPKCKRTFTRLRHYNTHRCFANSDYVDITKKESLAELENEFDSEPNHDMDDDAIITKVSAPRVKRMKIEKIPVAEALQILDSGEQAEPNVSIEMDHEQDPGVVTYASSTTAPIKVRPIFEDEPSRKEFEDSLNVDLSQIDHMFKTHIIEQNVNEHAPPPSSKVSPNLTIYSCNTCDKVFKTVSHMRHHCLIHTNLKPFKCPKCAYASNSKGNLYTHIRKHTGQFFCCSQCKFKTVNKSHLNEHLATHNLRKLKCRICKKEYSTNKSLYNHVRKYHSRTEDGAAYLKEFTPRVNKGQAVLHQCHVCNRKFKKRMDRDRHLFVHNIRTNPNVFACELCDYTASRGVYLENHIRKHRIVYQCAACQQKFLSTIRLNDHISEKHLGDVAPEPTDKDWGDLFEASINCSLYLPEPDGTIDHLGQSFLKAPKEEESGDNPSKEDGQALDELKEAIEDSMKEGPDEPGEVTHIINELSANLQPAEEPNVLAVAEPLQPSEAQTSENAASGQTSETAPDAQTLEGISNESLQEDSAAVQQEDSAAMQKVDEDRSQVEGDGEGVSKSGEDGKSETAKPAADDSELPSEATDVTAVEGKDGTEEEPMETTEDNDPAEAGEADEPEDLNELEPEEHKQISIFEKLDYQPMNMDVLTKLRETFGNQECEFCGRLFYSQLDYDPHLRTHTGDKPFACEDCNYRSITRENLKRHRERHHQQVSLKCDKCDFVASCHTQLWTHQHKHKEEESPSSMCPVCHAMFPSKKALGAHLLTVHPGMSREEARKATGYNHRLLGKIGRRSYKCPYCDKVFTRANSDLQKHIWIHEGIKPFKCSLCSHACRSMNNLKNHMLRHSQTKPFMCGTCGKFYKSRTALRWHMRCHREGRLFKCDRCPYEAIQKSHLKRHMETHDIIKKYVCEHCEYSANTLGYMKIHYSKFHRDMPQREEVMPSTSTIRELPPNTKAFKCLSCDYIFGNIWDIKRHLKVRHHLHVEDIRALETTEVSRIVPADVVSVQEPEAESSVEVIEVNEGETLIQRQTDEDEAREALETLQYSTVTSGDNIIDEKTASAVNILQQIIDMSQQGAFPNQSQQITVQSEDGQMVTMNPPETIILQQDGQELVVSSDSTQALVESGEYVIQVMDEATNSITDVETVVTSAQAIPQTITIPEGATEILSVSAGNDFLQAINEEGNVITTVASVSAES